MLGNQYSEEQEELFGQYIAEFAVGNNLNLHEDDIIKAIELSDECTHRQQPLPNASIQDITKGLDFVQMDEDIVEIISVL